MVSLPLKYFSQVSLNIHCQVLALLHLSQYVKGQSKCECGRCPLLKIHLCEMQGASSPIKQEAQDPHLIKNQTNAHDEGPPQGHVMTINNSSRDRS